jgi:hypothetical protein
MSATFTNVTLASTGNVLTPHSGNLRLKSTDESVKGSRIRRNSFSTVTGVCITHAHPVLNSSSGAVEMRAFPGAIFTSKKEQ